MSARRGTEPAERFPRDGWFLAAPPGSRGKFIGAIIALALVLPFVVGTLLERGLGEGPAVVILAAVGGVALIGCVLLLVRRYRVLAAFAGALALGGILATGITAVLDW